MTPGLKKLADQARAVHRRRPPLHATLQYFKDLPEYSCSLPTGTTLGKRWRCAIHVEPWGQITLPEIGWMIGEYYEIPGDKTHVGIRWYRPVVRVPAVMRRETEE